MNPAIAIQVSLKSQRLPLKALRPLGGVPMIIKLIQNLEYMSKLGIRIYVCIPEYLDHDGEELEGDILIERTVEEYADNGETMAIWLARGSLNNLAERFLNIPEEYNPIIRVTGDNPYTNVNVMIELLAQHHKHKSLYTYPVGIPRGLKSEIIDRSLLERMAKKLPEARQELEFSEWLVKNSGKSFVHDFSDTWPNYKEQSFTCDTREDYERLCQIEDSKKSIK